MGLIKDVIYLLIGSIILFPFVYYVFKKLNLLKKYRIILSFISSILLIPTIVYGIFWYIFYETTIDFDKVVWNNVNMSKFDAGILDPEESPRVQMRKYIEESGMLIGKTIPEVQEILGDEKVRNYQFGEEFIDYSIGRIPNSFAPGWGYLRVIFRDGRVIKVYSYTD